MKTIKQLINTILIKLNLHPSCHMYVVNGKYVSHSVYMQSKEQ